MNKIIKKIVLISMFLSLGIIFSYISNFIPFFVFNFLKVDISIIFFMIPLSIIGYWYSFFIIIVIGFVNMAWSTTGFIGPIILIISNISFITIFVLLSKINKIKYSKIVNIVIALLINAIFLAFLNGIIFTPFFVYLFTDVSTISFIEISKNYDSGLWYDKLKIFFMFVPNYWSGIFALYISFNLFKFAIGSIIYLYIDNIITKNELIKLFQNY